jgi:hypothetical protein
MSEMTLLEAAKLSQDVIDRTITKIVVERSPILEYIPFKTINGPTFRYTFERSLGSVAFRAVGGTYIPDQGVVNPQFENLVIAGGEVKIDNFIVDVVTNVQDAKGTYYPMKARAMGLLFSETFFEGDTSVNPYAFDGIRKRIVIPATGITGGQYLNAADTGATLTFDLIDQLLDLVIGDNSDKVLFLNKTLRRKMSSLARTQTGTARIDYNANGGLSAFNKQIDTYAGCPIRVIERDDDASTFLGFDEDDSNAGGGNLDTASIYCVRFGMEYVHGISNKMMPSVRDFGEQQAFPGHMGRIESYMGLVVRHPRSVARLSHVNNA